MNAWGGAGRSALKYKAPTKDPRGFVESYQIALTCAAVFTRFYDNTCNQILGWTSGIFVSTQWISWSNNGQDTAGANNTFLQLQSLNKELFVFYLIRGSSILFWKYLHLSVSKTPMPYIFSSNFRKFYSLLVCIVMSLLACLRCH